MIFNKKLKTKKGIVISIDNKDGVLIHTIKNQQKNDNRTQMEQEESICLKCKCNKC